MRFFAIRFCDGHLTRGQIYAMVWTSYSYNKCKFSLWYFVNNSIRKNCSEYLLLAIFGYMTLTQIHENFALTQRDMASFFFEKYTFKLIKWVYFFKCKYIYINNVIIQSDICLRYWSAIEVMHSLKQLFFNRSQKWRINSILIQIKSYFSLETKKNMARKPTYKIIIKASF